MNGKPSKHAFRCFSRQLSPKVKLFLCNVTLFGYRLASFGIEQHVTDACPVS